MTISGTLRVFVAGLLLVIIAFLGVYLTVQSPTRNAEQGTQQVTVRFAMIPYGDHTYAIIGVKKGWFEEVGIKLQYDTIKVEQVVPFLKNHSYDVISTSPGLLLAAYDNAPNLGMFVFGTLFQGYAIMAQPNSGYKTYDQFVAEGLTPAKAIKATISQLRGKVFAYPSEGGIQPFIELALSRGSLSRNEFRALVVDDPIGVNAMRTKEADFQVGGAPSRVTLQREGFIPIISAIDFVKSAAASPESLELSAIFPDGWATTREYFQNNRDTILRLASVNFRIIDLINRDPEEALTLHLPYLSQVTGQNFTREEGLIIYKHLDPFISLDAQAPWFEDPGSPLFINHVIGAHIASFKAQGLLQHGSPKVEDIIYAIEVYQELMRLRVQALTLLRRLEVRGLDHLSDTQRKRLNNAKTFFDHFNYLDSVRQLEVLVSESGN